MLRKVTVPCHIWPRAVVTHKRSVIRNVSLSFVMSQWANFKPVEGTKTVVQQGPEMYYCKHCAKSMCILWDVKCVREWMSGVTILRATTWALGHVKVN